MPLDERTTTRSAVNLYRTFAASTLAPFVPCNPGKPSGKSNDLNGFGSTPLRRISLALVAVPQGGAKCANTTFFCDNIRMNML
eukprot:2609120-Karenia_brevis.AAC.1